MLVLYEYATIESDIYMYLSKNAKQITYFYRFSAKLSALNQLYSQVSYCFLTAENLLLVLSRGSFLFWWRGGLVQ